MGMGQSSSHDASTTHTRTPPGQVEKLLAEFDKLFADMEFRAKRAALMNYHEAERCDKRADQLQMLSTTVATLGVSGIGASVVRTKRVAANSAGVAGLLALPLSGVLQFLASGSSTMAPTMSEKARDHTRAGAGWQRIARQSHAYRLQLKYLTADTVHSSLLTSWYRELVDSSEQVSKILPIKADTYAQFDQAESVRDRLKKRDVLNDKYLAMEAYNQNK